MMLYKEYAESSQKSSFISAVGKQLKLPSSQDSLLKISAFPSARSSLPSQLSYSDSESDSFSLSNSAVSFEQDILADHLEWLDYSILKLCNSQLEIAFALGNLSPFDSNLSDQQESLLAHVARERSLIPRTQTTLFLGMLEKYPNYALILEWIYAHVQPRLGDELILVAYRILLAFLPVRHLAPSREQIHAISVLPFNLANIYSDRSLKIMHFEQLYKQVNGHVWFDSLLHSFSQSYVETILLILQQYFQNPHLSLLPPTFSGKQSTKIVPLPKKKRISKKH